MCIIFLVTRMFWFPLASIVASCKPSSTHHRLCPYQFEVVFLHKPSDVNLSCTHPFPICQPLHFLVQLYLNIMIVTYAIIMFWFHFAYLNAHVADRSNKIYKVSLLSFQVYQRNYIVKCPVFSLCLTINYITASDVHNVKSYKTTW